jgi:hypothetical protein
MKQRLIVVLAAALLTLAGAAKSSAISKICYAECNVDHRSYCLYTGSCSDVCYVLSGGCMSGSSAECLDACAL